MTLDTSGTTQAAIASSPSLQTSIMPPWFRVLRPHQWSKNVLLLMPAALAHLMPWHGADASQRWLQLLGAIVAFSLAASAIYVINDLIDIEADRQHPTKRHRPFAAGRLNPRAGPFLALGLILGAGAVSAMLPRNFWLVLSVYGALSMAYSFWLKRVLLLDVFVLAGLYTLRLIAGGAAAEVLVSNWLLAFSIFLFTSLAFAKRYVELHRVGGLEDEPLAGRAYRPGDLDIVRSVGPASGYMAVLVLALYVNDSTTAPLMVRGGPLYPEPRLLWVLCPLLMYWITRIWFLASRDALDDDPITYALRDRVSWCVLLAAAAMVVGAWQPWR